MQPQINTDEHRLNELTFAVNGCAMDVLNKVGHGFHEKIYENAMAVALSKRNIDFSQQKQFKLEYEEQEIGVFIPDLVIEDKIIVELKTIDKIGNNEKGQVLNYLKATNLRLGLIINFKNPKLEWQRVIHG
jgi:GxxExxY protein